MRIVAGALKGRVLKTVSGPGYRPATGRVREAIFSMLESRGLVWSGARVLDLFAGSGSLAFEALSRGAVEACLVERSSLAVNCLRRNAEALGLGPDRCRLVEDDVSRFLRQRPWQAFDLVFIDPPYGENRLAPSLGALLRGGWLNDDAFVLAELEAGLPLAGAIKGFPSPDTDRTYGQTRILLWQLSPNG